MVLPNPESKVKREHLEKLAYVYVRQSTLGGVKRNIVGGRRQREDVINLALQLGWPQANIKLIDEDQAITGSSTHGRYGYLDMLNAIAKQCVGAVFSLESSRMARDSADWHCLIKLCHLTGTLVIDPDGVYDASDTNDSILMKMKALLGEMELHLIYQRIAGARRDLAKTGTLRFCTPIGFVYGDDGKLIFDPNQEVQDAVRLVFSTFDRVRSSTGVAKYFWRQQVKFPSLIRTDPNRGEYKWVRLKLNRARGILGNPVYAGAYVYGRSVTKLKVVLDQSGVPQVQKYTAKVPREAWDIVIQNAHESYISWDRFVENQEVIRNNGSIAPGNGNRAPRLGGGLLQGIAVCGKCGRRMSVTYPHRAHRPNYNCTYESQNTAPDQCQSMPGAAIDAAIEKLFLQAVEPAQLKMSFEALERVDEQSRQLDRRSAATIKRAATAVAEAKERLLAVDFNNKYAFACVQEELKRKEEELAEVNRQHTHDRARLLQNLTPEERQSIENSLHDLPTIWGAASTDMVAKKNLIRCLIQDVTIKRDGYNAHLAVRWKTLASTRVTIQLRKRGDNSKVPADIVDFITKLAPDHTNTEIANRLNESGIPHQSRPFTSSNVRRIRRTCRLATYQLGSYPEQRKDGRYKASTVAKTLGVTETAVRRWCRTGRLDGVRETGSNLWWIKLEPPEASAFRQTIRCHKSRQASQC